MRVVQRRIGSALCTASITAVAVAREESGPMCTPVGAGSLVMTSRGQVCLTPFSVWVDDLAAATARLVEHGGTVLEPTRQNLGVDLVFLADPAGVRVELLALPG